MYINLVDPSKSRQVLNQINSMFGDIFGITDSTIQIENNQDQNGNYTIGIPQANRKDW